MFHNTFIFCSPLFRKRRWGLKSTMLNNLEIPKGAFLNLTNSIANPQLSDCPHPHPFNFAVTTLFSYFSLFSCTSPRDSPWSILQVVVCFLTLGNPENKTKNLSLWGFFYPWRHGSEKQITEAVAPQSPLTRGRVVQSDAIPGAL